MKETMIEVAKVLIGVVLIAALFVLATKVGDYVQSGADKIPDEITGPDINISLDVSEMMKG